MRIAVGLKKKSVYAFWGICLPIFVAACTDPMELSFHEDGVFEEPHTGAVFDSLSVPPADSEGWTVVNASADTLTWYVSSSEGDDANDGTTAVTAFATLDRAREALIDAGRSGYPDHILLKKGDVWRNKPHAWSLSGRSESEPMIISSYGSGPRPRFEGNAGFSFAGNRNVRHVWLIGVEFYCTTGDPASADFDIDVSRSVGVGFTGGGGDILVEDCKFSYQGGGAVIQRYESDGMTDIKIRRCVFDHAYSTSSHTQGLYAYEVTGLLIEECVFDHNGWLVQGDGHNTQAGGGATMFNHNTYINQCNQVRLKGNLFLRPSSIGNKFNSNGPNESIDTIVDDNFYYDGEIGISIGGNTDDEYRFGNTVIKNNIFTNIGRSNMTTRNFSWGIEVKDNFNTRVVANGIINQALYGNSYGIQLSGRTNNSVILEENLFYNVNGSPLRMNVNPQFRDIVIRANRIDNGGTDFSCVRNIYTFEHMTYEGNSYFSDADEPFYSEDTGYTDIAGWTASSGETEATFAAFSYTDSSRTLESYHISIGGSGVPEDYISEASLLSKDNWDERYLAAAVNAYYREGFDIQTAE